MSTDDKEYMVKWRLSLNELYTVGLKFYEEVGNNEIHLSYSEKIRLVAFTWQVAHGKYNDDKYTPRNMLDITDHDRRTTWKELGDMSQRDAMAGFINLIDNTCSNFNGFVRAEKFAMEEQKKLEEKRELEITDENSRKTTRNNEIISDSDSVKICVGPDTQLYSDFGSDNKPQNSDYSDEEQEELEQTEETEVEELEKPENPHDKLRKLLMNPDTLISIITHDGDSECSDDSLHEAAMWTRSDIVAFKRSFKPRTKGIIKVDHGETYVVRIPTQEGCSHILWEFATDNYDIAFGLSFEWSKPMVGTHGSDEDSDSEESDGPDIPVAPLRIENAFGSNLRPPVSEIIPLAKRECHKEVYTGTHEYPDEGGVYLLLFDNTYSIWRSKTVYYRVYHSEN